ncbi:unnamed protein product [Closterium sp. Yama58-4]|nr:unnamed protein product [Closterium sp. Yama58-4]
MPAASCCSSCSPPRQVPVTALALRAMALRGHCSPHCPLAPPLPPSSSQALFPTAALHVCARAPSIALWPAFSPTRLVPLHPHQLPCPRRLAVAPTLPPSAAPFLQLLIISARPTTGTFRAPRASASDPRGGVPAEWADGPGAAGTTLYDVLGLARRDASMHDIKLAYRREARRYHPDSRAAGLSEAESTRRFIAVQRAYDVLSNPQQRARYDWELLHPLVAGARHGGMAMGSAKRWRHGMRRPWMGQAMWDSVEEQLEVKAAWRQQWHSQLAGLRHSRTQRWQPRSEGGESWGAARRREQQVEGEEVSSEVSVNS